MKAKTLDKAYFNKEEFFERNGKKNIDFLQKSKVCILGLGGLGSNVANMLVRCGIGNLRLVDFDRVELSNLNRQIYTPYDLGKFKAEALKEKLTEISPFTELDIIIDAIDENNIYELTKDYDIVCEAVDKAETKALIVNSLMEISAEKIVVSASGMAGLENGNNIKSRKAFKNLYIVGDEVSDQSNDVMMMPRVMLCAAHQANLIVRLILGKEEGYKYEKR